MARTGPTPSPLSSGSSIFKRTTLGLTPAALENLDKITERWGVSKYLAVSVVLEACDPEDPSLIERLKPYLEELEQNREAKRKVQDRVANLSADQLDKLSSLLDKL